MNLLGFWRSLLGVRTILFGVRLLHDYTLSRLLNSQSNLIRVQVKIIVVESLELREYLYLIVKLIIIQCNRD